MSDVINNEAFGDHRFNPQDTINEVMGLSYSQGQNTFQVLIALQRAEKVELHKAEEEKGKLEIPTLSKIQEQLESIGGPSKPSEIKIILESLKERFLTENKGEGEADPKFSLTSNGNEVVSALSSKRNEVLWSIIIPPKCPVEKFSNDSMYYIGNPVPLTA